MEIITLFILGFVASFLGTVAMTASQEIEIKIRKRPISYTPAVAVYKILNLNFEVLSEKMKGVMSYVVHFAYGTVWGVLPVLLSYFGVASFWALSFVFFLIVWIQGLVIIPLFGIAGPPWTWGMKEILIEILHKFIYSVATIYIFLLLASILL